MLLDLLWQISIWLVAFGLICFAILCYLHFNKIKRVAGYVDQGVYMLPGWDSFLVGNMPHFGVWEAACYKAEFEEKNADSLHSFFPWLMD